MKHLKYIFLLMTVALFIGCFSANKENQGQQNNVKEPSADTELEVILSPQDSVVFEEFFADLDVENLKNKELSEIIVHVALYFQDAPYVAHTLEISEDENLVINLREFDCTTFVENVLALSYLIKSGNHSFDRFVDVLKDLRYRGGIISGYPSRLHYFTDWLFDNEKKGVVHLVSNDFGDIEFNASVNFMSMNYSLYPALERDSLFVEEMRSLEKKIASVNFKKVSPGHIAKIIDFVDDGDVVAFSTIIDGLDFSHVGFAFFSGNELRFIHASTNGNRVKVSQQSLEEYVKDKKHVDGVLIARPLEEYLLN
ncbi:N-acetylmuramoyl-L-alanine amidase-like domain-containing protein [Marinilabilia salmonicolor]|uniref:N-acetylmuramoyl-L-alanine amidase-like domain-containing protein n=1 Tax=Marinilabilia salmonicolor TaxID=989 RepID=UPI0002D555DA|nr:N-acetylmuramoyl-L-alanine amidase-like domain-containing protein [Marinilabilia salmonicolor]